MAKNSNLKWPLNFNSPKTFFFSFKTVLENFLRKMRFSQSRVMTFILVYLLLWNRIILRSDHLQIKIICLSEIGPQIFFVVSENYFQKSVKIYPWPIKWEIPSNETTIFNTFTIKYKFLNKTFKFFWTVTINRNLLNEFL